MNGPGGKPEGERESEKLHFMRGCLNKEIKINNINTSDLIFSQCMNLVNVACTFHGISKPHSDEISAKTETKPNLIVRQRLDQC